MSDERRYTDWKEIGKGAFGSVYRVFDTVLRRNVAIKLLQEKHCANQMLVDALHQEVVISRDLRHDNICPIHDVYQGRRGVGTVMDFIDGVELSHWQRENRGRLLDTAADRLELFRKLSGALAFAHTRIVHRDLKPDNIFLRQGDPSRPVIMDFGTSVLGAVVGDADVAGTPTGTPKYMSPEQWNTPDAVDQRADLFSLGVIAYELFTDQIPPTSLRSVIKTRTPPRVDLATVDRPSSFCVALPADLDRIILQLMAYHQQDRPQSATEVLDALQRVVLNKGGIAPGKGGGVAQCQTVLLPGGKFYLGSAQAGGMSHERPRKQVELSPFRVGVYPVTVAEFRLFVRTTGYTAPPFLDDAVFGRDDHPVVGVDYADAMAYACWAGGALPSEAQWEYAAKGGEAFPTYPWGNDPPTAVRANIDGVSRSTSPVGGCSSGVNPFGLFDLCGNVWEWCLDVWDPGYYSTLAVGCKDPVCQAKGTERVLRGGGFDSFASQGRCSARFHAPPESRNCAFGLRLVFPA